MPTCNVCGYESDTTRGINIHKAQKHPEANSSSKKEYTCEQCSKVFKDYESRRETRDRKNFFCSRKCKDEYETGEIFEFSCSWCGDEVKRHPSNAHDVGEYEITNHFCSKDCESAYKSSEWVGENHPSWIENTVEKQCDECGSDIEVKEYYLDKQKNFFCSVPCHNTFQTSQTHGECYQCGDGFELEPYQRTGNNGLFCSNECSSTWLSENRRGDKNPMWLGGKKEYYGGNWNTVRRKRIQKDGYECVLCEKSRSESIEDHGRDLEVHHLTPIRLFDDPEDANVLENLATLCSACHKRVEFDKEELERDGIPVPE